MRGKTILIAAAIILVSAVAFILMGQRINRLTVERDRYKGNNESLMSDVEYFKVRDSLNAARVQSLKLTISEFERFRSEDAALIKSLQKKNTDLAAVNKAQSATIIALYSRPRDTVIVTKDSTAIPAVAVHCGDEWYDFEGIITADEFKGQLVNRDSLILAEIVKYHRFLGFLWKTNRIDDRNLECVSKNPHTQIMGVEHVIISK